MNARGLVVAVGTLPWLLAGCVVEQRDFESLREQVRLQQKQINDLKARQEEQGLRVETLNNGFKILGDKAEDNSRRIDGIEERGADLALQSASSPAPVSPTAAAPVAPGPAAPAVALPAAPATTPAVQPLPATPPAAPSPSVPILLTNLPRKENPEAAAPKKEVAEAPPAGDQVITTAPRAEKLYASALALYSNRQYAEATTKFQEFVGEFPDHKLAGNAQYWIGECHYTQRRFGDAAEEFAKVERIFPSSPKVPASLYKKGLSLWEVKRTADAQAALQHLVDAYPQSEEAGKAREKLERWKKP